MICMICSVLGQEEERCEQDESLQEELDNIRKTIAFLTPRIAALHHVC